MSNIDKHDVQAVADLKAGYTLGHADVAILNELARIALASLEAEAVCVIDQSILIISNLALMQTYGLRQEQRWVMFFCIALPRQRRYLCPLRWKWMMTLTARLNTEKLSAGTPIAQPCFRVPIDHKTNRKIFRKIFQPHSLSR